MRKMKFNMTMRLKLITSFGGVLLVFLAVAFFNLHQVSQIKQNLNDQNEKVELKVLALELKEMVQEMNIIASGLEISKKSEYISKYNNKRIPFNEYVKQIGNTAATPEQQKWRSQLIQASVDYINNFDTASKMVMDTTMKPADLEINLLYLYNESQVLKDQIFGLVDKFYVTYAEAADQAVSSSTNALNNTSQVMIIAPAIVLVITIIVAFLITQSFTRPIIRLQKAVSLIASGDLTHTINSTSKDELGKLSDSFDHMIVQVRQMLSATLHIASSLSEHSHAFHRFSQLTAAANTDILKAIHEISAGADEQAMKSEMSSLIIAELETEIRDINAYTDQMRHTSDAAAVGTKQGTESVRALKASADQSHAVLHKVDAAMQTLAASSKQIGAIVHSITEISTQTNVLALNAAIEAARAGVHGRGFSVIADEVRQLSQQTSDSSKTISGIVQALQKQIQELQISLVEAKESVVTQNHRVTDTLGSFEGIEQSMHGIQEQIEQIHLKIEQARSKNDKLVDSVQFVAAIAQETAAGVEEVNSTSIQQDVSIRRIAEESDDILDLAQQLFAEISKFQIDEASRHNVSIAPEDESTPKNESNKTEKENVKETEKWGPDEGEKEEKEKEEEEEELLAPALTSILESESTHLQMKTIQLRPALEQFEPEHNTQNESSNQIDNKKELVLAGKS
ncbi:methyl-accepting chemotaxis protein [Paenibacillus sp. SYP-B3998]|uniref:Methyl-accepting chemotaxis protein n=1 Tax=Paenibacillus sp. SYP-B3998 TaxID=2678564 RepID=A0A6G4A005_9BACL|nr:methyl-accepting chemotaxis protein [Paenibacillus sp. SYP-B3998]NEW07680.1 methyl-accepting chemotaxis protein [Paenibacillus sp. SYP-B3998]